MKIKRFKDDIEPLFGTNYESDILYYMIFDNNEDFLYDNISKRTSELEKNDVDYDIFYTEGSAIFLFIYPHKKLRNILKYDYTYSNSKNKDKNKELYLSNGYEIIKKEDLPLLITTNKFNI